MFIRLDSLCTNDQQNQRSATALEAATKLQPGKELHQQHRPEQQHEEEHKQQQCVVLDVSQSRTCDVMQSEFSNKGRPRFFRAAYEKAHLSFALQGLNYPF